MNITNLIFEQALSRIQDHYTQLPPHQQRILLDRISQLSQDQLLMQVNKPLPVRQVVVVQLALEGVVAKAIFILGAISVHLSMS